MRYEGRWFNENIKDNSKMIMKVSSNDTVGQALSTLNAGHVLVYKLFHLVHVERY